MGVPGFLVGLACGSVVLAWRHESASCSILVAAPWHGTYNLTSATAAAHGTVDAVASTGVMAVAPVVAWKLWRHPEPVTRPQNGTPRRAPARR